MSKVREQRPSPIAGLWYSGSPQRLRQQVDTYIEEADIPDLDGEIIALVAPHAGHRYSGRTAGHAFKTVKGRSYDLVVVVSPFHSYHSAQLLTSAHRAYATPMGALAIDEEALCMLDQKLKDDSDLFLTAIAEDGEHSLEIELPFLQCALEGEFKLLPLMVHSHSEQVARALGEALADIVKDRSVLLVASTDLSHFYSEEVAAGLDRVMQQQIEDLSPGGVLEAERSGKGFACGAGAVAAVLFASLALGANSAQVLHHSTSGEETGDYNSVVGYGAAVIQKKP